MDAHAHMTTNEIIGFLLGRVQIDEEDGEEDGGRRAAGGE